MLPPALYWQNGFLFILDQRRLPCEVNFIRCAEWSDVAAAIETLAVRGAPAIGIAAAYGAALAASHGRDEALKALRRLALTRPTAVNLFWAPGRMEKKMASLTDEGLFDGLLAEAGSILAEDLACNRAMGEAGVTAALEVIRKEMDITMALCGERDVKNMGRHNLLVPEDFEGRWA